MTTQLHLWDLLFSGDFCTDIFVSMILLAGIFSLYSFLLCFFQLKSIIKEDADFLHNIADCIHDQRIESAEDLCKRTPIMISTIVEKGIRKMKNGSIEIFPILQAQTTIELTKIHQKKSFFGVFPMLIFLSGLLGSLVSWIGKFWSEGQNSLEISWAMPMLVGSALAIIGGIFFLIIHRLIGKVDESIREQSLRFIELVDEYQKHSEK